MKSVFLGLALSVLVVLPVVAALKVADKAPDFSARAPLQLVQLPGPASVRLRWAVPVPA